MSNMVKVLKPILMDHGIRVISEKMSSKGKEYFSFQMEINMKEISIIIKRMD
jgi:hypothetical protein